MRSAEATLYITPFFQSLPADELRHVLSHLRPVDLSAGQILFEEGQLGDSLFIITEGRLEIIMGLGTPDQRVVAHRGPGEYVGEMSLFDLDHLRSASVRAVQPAQLLELLRADFNALLDRYPRLAYDMVRVLNERLKESHNTALHDLRDKNRQLEQAYDELRAAQDQIIEQEKMQHELQLAHDIQMSILPRQMPAFSGFNFGARILPMSAVGGDFYDFIPLENGQLGIAIGDVSGHGVPAALFMALTVSLLRAEVCTEFSPARALQSVNRQLIRVNGEGMFVTVLYGVLSCNTGLFTFSRAGHSLPFVARAAGPVDQAPLQHGMALGLFDDIPFPEQTLQLAPGDTLLLYTDGVTEAMDASQQMFGEDRLKDILAAALRAPSGGLKGRRAAAQAAHLLPSQQLCEQILAQVTAFSAPDLPRDDITIIAAQAHPPS